MVRLEVPAVAARRVADVGARLVLALAASSAGTLAVRMAAHELTALLTVAGLHTWGEPGGLA
eukprot:8084678-Pyramimonas_sp.AAC.1